MDAPLIDSLHRPNEVFRPQIYGPLVTTSHDSLSPNANPDACTCSWENRFLNFLSEYSTFGNSAQRTGPWLTHGPGLPTTRTCQSMRLLIVMAQSKDQDWTIQPCIAEHIPLPGFGPVVRPMACKWCSCHPPLAACFDQIPNPSRVTGPACSAG